MEQDRKAVLRVAAQMLRERGMFEAAKWTSEQVLCVKEGEMDRMPEQEAMREEDEDRYSVARSYFDLKEYLRCAHVLERVEGVKARFLRCYARYLAGEKRKEEEAMENATSEDRAQGLLARQTSTNSQLSQVERDLATDSDTPNDGHCKWLLAVVLKEMDKKEEAMDALCASLVHFPWNWGAWVDLAGLCCCMGGAAVIDKLSLPDHWIRPMFIAYLLLESQEGEAAHARYTELLRQSPNCNHLLAMSAMANQLDGNITEAREQYEELIKRDPYRLDDLDVFSNMLYVMGDHPRLSHLAHHVHMIDKFRPESCCTIGNYYSLKQKHERAVLYFSRALRVNAKWLSAWTLMGHEYIEMKNSAAAIQAYRRAIEINPRDFRAWYGLGQTYEILQMHNYSLYYYQKVTTIKPNDSRFWTALGSCYSHHFNRVQEAIACYERAEALDDDDACVELARLYADVGDQDRAAMYHERNVSRNEQTDDRVMKVCESLQFLADHYRHTDRAKSQRYCLHLLSLDALPNAKDKAKALLREIQSAQHAEPASPQ